MCGNFKHETSSLHTLFNNFNKTWWENTLIKSSTKRPSWRGWWNMGRESKAISETVFNYITKWGIREYELSNKQQIQRNYEYRKNRRHFNCSWKCLETFTEEDDYASRGC